MKPHNVPGKVISMAKHFWFLTLLLFIYSNKVAFKIIYSQFLVQINLGLFCKQIVFEITENKFSQSHFNEKCSEWMNYRPKLH